MWTRGCGKARVNAWEAVIRRPLQVSEQRMTVVDQKVVTVVVELKFRHCASGKLWAVSTEGSQLYSSSPASPPCG